MTASTILLQDRDLELLQTLFESRIMTSAHATALHFEDKQEAAKKRLQKLKAAGLIAERRRRAYDPAILFLTRKGHDTLKAEGVLTEYPPISAASLERRVRVGDLRIQHELAIMDVKVAFHTATKQDQASSLEQFCTWPLLYEFMAVRPGYGGKEVPVKPDGFIHIKENAGGSPGWDHLCFLEVDRNTEVPDILAKKALCYLNYYRSGDFAIWNGATRSEVKDHPFRVLMVFKTAERRNNIAERLLQGNPQILTQVWMSTFEEVIANPLGTVWVRPQEYRDATKGTPFDAEKIKPALAYRRQKARDLLVKSKLRKRALLADA